MKHKLFYLCFLFLLMSTLGFAASRYAVASGNWNATTTWSATSGGSAGASFPVAGDNVYIAESTSLTTLITVTIPTGVTAECATIYMGPSGTTGPRPGTLAFASATSTLNVSGNVTMYRPSSSTADKIINIGAGTMNVTGNLTTGLSGATSGTTRECIIQLSTGVLSIGGNLVFSATADDSNNNITFSGAGTINIGGNFTATAGTITPSTGTVNFNGSSAQAIPIGIGSIVYYNLSFENSGTKTLGAAISATNVTGNVSVNGGTLANGGFAIVGNASRTFTVANGATFSLTGTSTMPSGFGTRTFGATSTVNYAGGVQSVTAVNYGNLTFSATGNKTAAAGLTVAGNFTITSGTFIAGSYTHNIAGNFSRTGTFTQGTSTINFNGTTAQTIGGSATTFNLVTINNTVGVTLNVAMTATTVTVGSGSILDKGNYAITGALTNNGTVKSTVATLASGTVTHGTNSTVEYTAAVAIPTGTTYKNILLSGNGTYTLGGAVTVANALTVSAVSTLNKAAVAITGALTNNGIVQSSVVTLASGTVTHNAGSTINYTAAVNFAGVGFKNLTLSASGSYNMTGALTVANTLTLSNANTYLHTANYELNYGSLAGSGSVVIESKPTVTTPTSASLTTNSALLGGNITSINNSNVTERGIYYSTTDGFADGAGTKVSTTGSYTAGVFTITAGSLISNQLYYFKAFATNAYGTAYTTQASFSTLPLTYTVDITSTPVGAGISVDGIPSGQVTPHQFMMVAGTSAIYTVSLAGYTFSPTEKVVNNISANTSQEFTGTIIPVPDIPAAGNVDIGGGPAAGGANIETTVDLYNGPVVTPDNPALVYLHNLNNVVDPIMVSYTGTGIGTITITVGIGTWYGFIYWGGIWHFMDIPSGHPLIVTSGTGQMVFLNVNLDAKGEAIIVLGEGENPLPVELSSFTADITSQYFINLTWVTQSESGVVGYKVYRSDDNSFSNSILMTPIMIPATNTTCEQTYSITDSDGLEANHTYYYWLENNDFGGGTYLHGPISATVTGQPVPVLPEISIMSKAYPNPFRIGNSTSFDVNIKAGEKGKVTIYNILGQSVKTYNLPQGSHKLTWDAKGCTSGIYFYQLNTPSVNSAGKLVIIK